MQRPLAWGIDGAQRTRRLSAAVIETVTRGRIDAALVAAWARDFARLGGAPTWLFDCRASGAYGDDAVTAATASFTVLQRSGLHRVVAVTATPLVRMGAAVVGMALGTSLPLDVVPTLLEAQPILAAQALLEAAAH